MKKLYALLIPLTFSLTLASQDMRTWATYYGSSGNEGAMSTAKDPWGNVYIAGITMSTTGIAFNGHQNTFGGGNVDAFVVKFNAAGNRIWGTYYGGGGDEQSFFPGRMGLSCDVNGNVYLCGLTNSPNAIASANGFQTTIGGGVDAYLVKFDSAGVRQWGTYYGGSQMDNAYDCSADANGNIYLAGRTGSTGLASNGFQNSPGGQSDAFLVKFDAAGARVWATYYGGTGIEEGFSVTCDLDNNVFLSGCTGSTTGIASGGFQNSFGGGTSDAFIVKFDTNCNRIWATYVGGNSEEWYMQTSDQEMVCGANGELYMSGYTQSTSGVSFMGAQNTFGGGTYDAFLLKVDSAGNRIWSTYYGGTGDEIGHGVALDTAGNVFLSGKTTSTSGISLGGFQTSHGGGSQDGFLAKFNPAGVRLCATYFGGNDYDTFEECAVGPDGTIYCGGNMATQSGLSFNGFQNSFGGGSSDAFLVKFTPCNDALTVPESLSASMNVYPNPASNQLNVTAPVQGTLEIVNELGQVVFTEPFSQRKIIDISSFAEGIYLLRITDRECLLTQKIIIQ